MRKIKFRAWDGGDMRSWDQLKAGRLITLDFLEGLPGVTFEQYTGFDDRNGVEIYEGDVVQRLTTHYRPVFQGTVEFIDGSYVIDDVRRDWRPRLTDRDVFNPYVVIGNIHQNPELIPEVD